MRNLNLSLKAAVFYLLVLSETSPPLTRVGQSLLPRHHTPRHISRDFPLLRAQSLHRSFCCPDDVIFYTNCFTVTHTQHHDVVCCQISMRAVTCMPASSKDCRCMLSGKAPRRIFSLPYLQTPYCRSMHCGVRTSILDALFFPSLTQYS